MPRACGHPVFPGRQGKSEEPQRTGYLAFAGYDECAFGRILSANRQVSDLLIVFADLGMGAQHLVDHLEHIAHALFGDRAFDHDDQLGLVR